MTMPNERTRSVVQTREFLRGLFDPEHFSSVPDDVRRQAKHLLRHNPWDAHIDAAAVAWPYTWAPTNKETGKAPSYANLMASLRFERDTSEARAGTTSATSDSALGKCGSKATREDDKA